MATTTVNESSMLEENVSQVKKEKNSLWWDAYRKLKSDKVAVVSFFIILTYVLAALLSMTGLIFTDFAVTNENATYQPPSWQHWLGTDFMGRDVFARAVHGIKTALTFGSIAGLLSIFIGTVLGSITGYFGGLLDDLIVWVYTTLDNIPRILLVASLVYVLGPSLQTLCVTYGIVTWTGICRLVRAEFLKHREQEYVQAARSIGAGHARRIFLHILPNVFHIVLIQFALLFVGIVKAEVILTYLGLGVEPGTPSWGVMIDDARLELARGVWWNFVAATGFMFFLILAVNLFTDALREALDPKSK